jgi:tripartite-type tricarboxylate transporter receptor subunit TctC
MKHSQRRAATAAAILFTLCASLAASPAAAQTYPAKPIKVMVPFAAGGVADITARVLSQRVSETIGQQMLVENRPSAGGIAASEAVAKADPDGYTLLLVSNGTAVSASLFRTLPYDTLKDFAGVSTAGFFDIGVFVGPDSNINNVRDLIAFAKANPNKLSVGTINIGSTQHLSGELFKSMAGIDVQIVPYKATPAVITALRGGEIQVAFEILAPVMAQVKSGALKAIGVASEHRFAGLSTVPTVMESGLPGYQASSWNGISAPAKTPRPVIDRLNREIVAALATPAVRQRLFDLGVEAKSSTPEALQALLTSEITKWGGVIERARIEKQ